jgi:hypothetical protein
MVVHVKPTAKHYVSLASDELHVYICGHFLSQDKNCVHTTGPSWCNMII